MISYKPLSVALALLSITYAATVAHAQAARQQKVSISLRSLAVAPGERIVGFHLEVTSGRIARLPEVPIGWNLSVDNDPSWNTKLDASVIVASAALAPDFFKNFAVIEKHTSDARFDITGDIIVSRDFASTRTIHVGMKDFVFRPVDTDRTQAARDHRN